MHCARLSGWVGRSVKGRFISWFYQSNTIFAQFWSNLWSFLFKGEIWTNGLFEGHFEKDKPAKTKGKSGFQKPTTIFSYGLPMVYVIWPWNVVLFVPPLIPSCPNKFWDILIIKFRRNILFYLALLWFADLNYRWNLINHDLRFFQKKAQNKSRKLSNCKSATGSNQSKTPFEPFSYINYFSIVRILGPAY